MIASYKGVHPLGQLIQGKAFALLAQTQTSAAAKVSAEIAQAHPITIR